MDPDSRPCATHPYRLPPPPPPPPVQWLRARRLVRDLVADPTATERVFELVLALGGRGDERTVQRFASHPLGARMLREKPVLLDVLADRKRLEAMPLESFGCAYLAFSARNGFAADGLLQARDRGAAALAVAQDPERRWFFDRLNLMHDLWHVLTGYGTDPAGEMALLAFSIAQGMANRALPALLVTGLAMGPKRDLFAFQRFVLQAGRRGRHAARLLVQPYEELLPEPLWEVRRRLGIEPIARAHPGGVFRAEGTPRTALRVSA